MGSDEAANPGMASLVALDTPHDLVEVQVRTFDQVAAPLELQRIDVVKIDVQGYECHTLEGMTASITGYRPVVIFEYEDWALQQAGSTIADFVKFSHDAQYRLFELARSGRCRPLDIEYAQTMTHAEIVAVHAQDPRLSLLLHAVRS